MATVYEEMRKAGRDKSQDVFFMKQKIHNVVPLYIYTKCYTFSFRLVEHLLYSIPWQIWRM